jgi:uncharacterized membrane protein
MPEQTRDSAMVRGLGLGVAAGCRSTLGLLGPVAAGVGPPRGRGARMLAAVGVVGELVGDKLPVTPSRVAAPGPFVRAVAGAAGALRLGAGAPPARRLALASAGAVGALGGTWGGYGGRRLFERRAVPDWPAAVAEDVVALALAATCLGVRPGRSPSRT